MNLDELKILWQEHAAHEVEAFWLRQDEIRTMLRHKSKTALGKIQRNIKLEMAAVVILGLLGLWPINGSVQMSAVLIVGIYILASGLFYWYKYRALNRADIANGNLRSALEQLTHTMGRYMNIYRWFVILLIPVLGIGSTILGFLMAVQEDGQSLAEVPVFIFIILGGIGLLYAIIASLFTRWYLQKLYGRYYQALKDCLRELNDIEELETK
ncbi:MAG: hypothetical protein AAF206_08105 [Bacteroidota bacterium]